jgi:hypothetical protein
MTAKEIFMKFLTGFKQELEMAEQAPEAPKEGELKVSEVAIGGKVEIVDGEGNLQPAPDGEYQYGEDVLTVKDGLIEAINGEGKQEETPAEEIEAAEETPAEEPAQDEPKANDELEAVKAELEKLKAEIAEIKAAISGAATKEEMAAIKQEVDASYGEMNRTLATVISTPAQFSQTSNNNVVKDSKDEKTNALISMINNARKK